MIELQAIRKDGVYKMKIKDQTITHIRDLTTGCVACSVPSTSRTTSTSTTHAITQPHQHRARAREREKKRESEKARKREKEKKRGVGGWGGGRQGCARETEKSVGRHHFVLIPLPVACVGSLCSWCAASCRYDSRQADKKAILPTQSSNMITFYLANDSVITLRTSGRPPSCLHI